MPFDLPEGWCWDRLGNISNIARGGSPRPIESYITDDDNGVNWIKIGDTEKDGKYIYTTKEKIRPEGMTKSRYVESGDFLLTNSMSFGRPYILKTNGCIHDGWLVIGNIETVFNPDHLYYALSSDFMYQTLSLLAAGSTVKNLKSDTVKSVLFPVPPMQEQIRIADKLDGLIRFVGYIESNKSDLQSTIQLTKSKILDLAIRGKLVPQEPDDEPASVLLERIRAEKEELIKQGKIKRDKKESVIFRGEDNSYYETIGSKTTKIDDEIPFELPDGWEWCSLSQFASIMNGDRGKNYPSKDKLHDNGIPFISASDINNGLVVEDHMLYMTGEQYDLLSAGKLQFGDLVFCLRGSIGKCGRFYFENGAIASSLVIVRGYYKESVLMDYLYNYLISPIINTEIRKYDNGSAQPNLAANDFMKFYLPVPPLKEQKRIADKVSQLFSLLDSISESLN